MVVSAAPNDADVFERLQGGAPISLIDHAAGQIFLAYEPPARTRGMLRLDMKPLPRAITKLRKQIRDDCLAMTRAPHGVTAIAAPVFDADGDLFGSIALVGLPGDANERRLSEAVIQVQRVAARFTSRLRMLSTTGRPKREI
jgi:DNA-binding IclR family transcriptional regulator